MKSKKSSTTIHTAQFHLYETVEQADCCMYGKESDECCDYLSECWLGRYMSKLLGAMIMFCSLIELRGRVHESKLSECIICLIVCKSYIKRKTINIELC